MNGVILKIAVICLLLVFLSTGGRRYLYLAYQHIAYKIGFNLNNIASEKYVRWIKSQPFGFENDNLAIFLNNKVNSGGLAAEQTEVLGESAQESEKWIETDLSEQRLYMREGDRIVNSFLVSTGKWAPTPTGEWRIWTKLRYARMQGGSRALGTYYNLPNVPYTMYYNQGYGIHGAYWHNNFGQTMSHGCTNMKPEEAGIVYNWASVGTRVVVHE